jgi:hypothetical protein
VRGLFGFVRIVIAVALLASIPPVRVDAGQPPRRIVALPSLAIAATVFPPTRPSSGDCVSSPGVVEVGDVVIGTDGTDRIDCTGAPSGKVILGQAGDDAIAGSRHRDRIVAGDGDDTLTGGRGADHMDGGQGADTVSFRTAPRGVRADLRAGTATGEGTDVLESISRLVGSRNDDVLIGSPDGNVLRGGRGDDHLEGLGGRDDLRGGRGNDALIGGAGRDGLDGGRSRDACAEGTGPGTKSRCEAEALGEAMSVTLFAPAGVVIGVGFHESLFDVAAEIRPAGGLVANGNPAKFRPPAEETDGIDYKVLGTRGRPTPAATSADVVIGSSTAVLSPVTGTVVEVFRYALYCRAMDWELVIEPDGHPEARVIVLHFVDPQVRPGDRVVASVTRVGTSWVNDSAGAQENTAFPDQYPHVHVEVVRRGETPIPGCLLGV